MNLTGLFNSFINALASGLGTFLATSVIVSLATLISSMVSSTVELTISFFWTDKNRPNVSKPKLKRTLKNSATSYMTLLRFRGD